MSAPRVAEFFRGAVHDLRIRPRGNVPALDVLRSLAILLVFTAHYGAAFQAVPRVQALPIFNWGWTGVDLFFVLSGFLIGGQLWKEVDRTHRIQIGRFLLRRGLRIWPLYYAFVAWVAFEGLFGRSLSGLWSDVFFLSNNFHNQIGGGWSLSTEEQFYIVAPVSIALFSRIINPRRLWILPVVGMFFVVISRALAIQYEAHLPSDLYKTMYAHSDGLAVGAILAWCSVYRPQVIRSRWLRWSVCVALVAAAVGLHFLDRELFAFTALALMFGAATLLGLGLKRTPKLLDWHGFYIVSRLSYGMYLNHFGLLERASALLLGLRVKGGEPAFWILYLVNLMASIAIAFVTFQLIEWPFLQLRARWLASKKQPQMEAAEPATAST
ncbi:MAG: acyltransferase [Candidatus Korobacteraceae bacterium]